MYFGNGTTDGFEGVVGLLHELLEVLRELLTRILVDMPVI
jgi:hypothetical protein